VKAIVTHFGPPVVDKPISLRKLIPFFALWHQPNAD